MIPHDLFIAGAAVHVPGRITAADAVAQGLCAPVVARRTGMASVAVSDGPSGPEMAVLAARTALDRAGTVPEDIHLVLHADLYYQGHDIWAPASYVQGEVLGNRCPAIEIRQVSNGGLAAVQLAARYLGAAGAAGAALLTTGDRFCGPGFDRWASDTGTVYGDAGTAVVVSTREGFARVRGLASASRPELEGVHRGDDPFGAVPLGLRRPVDLDVLKRHFLERTGIAHTLERTAEGQGEAVDGALADAGVAMADIDWFVLPHFGLRRLTSTYLRPWQLDSATTTWPWARTVGHLGAGDQFSGLAHLVEQAGVAPGDLCLLAGVGAGYSWTCCVVEVLYVPSWGRSRWQPGPAVGA